MKLKTKVILNGVVTVLISITLVTAIHSVLIWEQREAMARERIQHAAHVIYHQIQDTENQLLETAINLANNHLVVFKLRLITENQGKPELYEMLDLEKRDLCFTLFEIAMAGRIHEITIYAKNNTPLSSVAIHRQDAVLSYTSHTGVEYRTYFPVFDESTPRKWEPVRNFGRQEDKGEKNGYDPKKWIKTNYERPGYSKKPPEKAFSLLQSTGGKLYLISESSIAMDASSLSSSENPSGYLGTVQMVRHLDEAFVTSMDRLTGTRVNFFSGTILSSGTANDYDTLDPALYRQMQSFSPKTPLARRTIFGEEKTSHGNYFKGVVPVFSRDNLAGAFCILISQKKTRQMQWKMISILLMVGLIAILLSLPLTWILAIREIMEREKMEKELIQHKEHLEEKVTARTSEIAMINHKLNEKNARLKETITQVEEAKRAAEAANNAKSTFLANMSHELRTPLNAIIGYSEMLIEESRESEETGYLAVDMERIHHAGKTLLSLINDILDISKIEAGKMELFVETFEVEKLVNGIIRAVKPLAEKNNNTLAVRCEHNLGVMRTDMTKTRQGLYNLLSNACKFTENGKIELDVTQEQKGETSWLVFRVSDTGIGIPQEHCSYLFHPFTQVDESTTRKFGGTGLGLAITRRFCQMMKGDIAFESEVGKGSVFTIHLPRCVDSDDCILPEPQNISPQIISGKQDLVLVIDDDFESRNLLSQMLKQEGFRVITANTGSEGVKMARNDHPDIITLDVMMPGIDGWSVLSSLKNDPGTCDIPVIMVTVVEDRVRGFSMGASEYLTKPVDCKELAKCTRKYRTAESPSVLLIEDDEFTRNLLKDMMIKEGWRVIEAENGKNGLAKLDEDTPSLILLDIMMPEMDGFLFTKKIGDHPVWRRIPVIVVTAKEMSKNERDELNAYVKRIFRKGDFSREDLFEAIRHLV